MSVAADEQAIDDLQDSQVLRNQRSVQRGWFLQAEEALRRGDQEQFQSLKARLEDYPLLPYLELRQIQRRLFATDSAEVMAVLDFHRDIPHSESLRQQWLTHLGSNGRWQELQTLSEGPLRGQRLQCLALRAELLDRDRQVVEGKHKVLNQRAESLWLTGRSLHNDCDPLLHAWRSQGGLTNELTWQRMQLALASNNANLARYLRRYLSADYRELGSQLLEVHHRPQRLKRLQEFRGSDPAMSDIVYHGMQQLIRAEPVTAEVIWRHYDETREFTPEQQLAIDRLLGLRLAVRYDDRALPWLQRASQQDSDPALQEWQARIHMRHGDWPAVQQVIAAMPELLGESARWQYWLARSVEEQGDHETADTLFHSVAQQRHFYGFLAADRVGVHYQLHHEPFVADPEGLLKVSRLPGIQRAKELYHLGRLHHARSEWHRTLAGADARQVLTAAQLASDWGWYERSVMGTIAVSAWNDLEMRFPLAYQELFTESAREHNVDINWVYALARQESAFMADAQSSKGALGLLQLLPATAAETAKKQNLSFNGRQSLLEPDTNIRLGSAHLAGLLKSFNGNRVLATAAYNAGEFRVSQWLKNGAEDLSTDVWLETMPYYETRQYVQNIMTYTIIYSDRRGYRVAGLLTPQELACACIE
ncbi:MAG: hypothetical protein EA349_09165 [Halomonadaceae bacterium]|nr:MAG: hypothetical protein EA349_09165 [Halomonadaceae bacterium]